ncbi:MAG: hypothetical protein COV44_01130 [Deltaproteobacteria bacterium CG11_big_fil_rev_8_21_14_0_20_45_16]|nr:MAG: hypothetical protein COV44_01130 [Deltaproteobacteria bacterium CG11_big_fil_rev_8_21_14_0_20_45_16]
MRSLITIVIFFSASLLGLPTQGKGVIKVSGSEGMGFELKCERANGLFQQFDGLTPQIIRVSDPAYSKCRLKKKSVRPGDLTMSYRHEIKIDGLAMTIPLVDGLKVTQPLEVKEVSINLKSIQ